MNYPLLSKLKESGVFTVKKISQDTFRVRERCDRYFSQEFTADELEQLGYEIIEMSKS